MKGSQKRRGGIEEGSVCCRHTFAVRAPLFDAAACKSRPTNTGDLSNPTWRDSTRRSRACPVRQVVGARSYSYLQAWQLQTCARCCCPRYPAQPPHPRCSGYHQSRLIRCRADRTGEAAALVLGRARPEAKCIIQSSMSLCCPSSGRGMSEVLVLTQSSPFHPLKQAQLPLATPGFLHSPFS